MDISNEELLKFAMENGMINPDIIQSQIIMREKEKFLSMHKSKIWQSTDKKWYTYLVINGKRKLVKRNREEDLKEVIAQHYKDTSEKQTLELTFNQWIEKKLKFEEISKQTRDRYTVDFQKYFKDYKDMDIKKVDSDFLEDFCLENIKKYNLKTKSFCNLKTILRGMFKFAKKRGYTTFNINEFISELEIGLPQSPWL